MRRVAFLGLGAMGAPMARRLVDAGHDLRVWNRTPGRAGGPIAAGAHRATTPAEAARDAEIVITMLADPSALEQVLFGAGGVSETIAPGSILIDMSTVGATAIHAAAERLQPVEVLDAPVLGSVPHAEVGTLAILVGGDRAALERCREVLDARAAAAQAYTLAALIHVGEVDFCQDAAAAVAAAVAAGMRPGTGVDDARAEALEVLHPVSGTPMRELISAAVALVGEASGYERFRERYLERFGQDIACDSRETVPAAFALATLADGDVRHGVELAANFGRDTDTIASMTGALCGAVGGPDAIPEAWIAALGPAAMLDAEDLAGRLAELARAKAAERERLSHTVPGLTDG
jgi:hypothetical protein